MADLYKGKRFVKMDTCDRDQATDLKNRTATRLWWAGFEANWRKDHPNYTETCCKLKRYAC